MSATARIHLMPDPGTNQPWLVGIALSLAAGAGAAIGAVVNGLFGQPKTRAEAQGIQVTAEVNLSDAALRMVGGLREELERVQISHRAELAELRTHHREELRIVREAHAQQMTELKRSLADSETDRILLKERCEHLETRVNELSGAMASGLTPLPEGGYDTGDTL